MIATYVIEKYPCYKRIYQRVLIFIPKKTIITFWEEPPQVTPSFRIATTSILISLQIQFLSLKKEFN